jgi:amino acid adenylation domain-containing protein
MTAPLISEKRRLLLERLLEKQGIAAPVRRIPRRSETGPAPLSFTQQRLWFLQRLDPESAAYNIPKSLHLIGALDIEALERSLAKIVHRHETLRTVFPEVAGEPVQVVLPPSPGLLRLIDLSGVVEEREAELARHLEGEGARPFDLARGPIVRFSLFRLAEQDHVLTLVVHHVAADAWSIDVFLRELTALYSCFSRGANSPLPALPIQYADFADWQRHWLTGRVLDDLLRIWRARLHEVPATLELQTDRPRTPVRTARGGTVAFDVGGRVAAAVRTLAHDGKATPFIALLTAFQALLHRWSGQDDFVVGSPVAGRNREELESLIGAFINTLALRADLSGEPSFKESLARTREVVMEAHSGQDLPFEKLVHELVKQDPRHAPLFQVLFSLQMARATRLELPGLALESLPIRSGAAQFDLTLQLSETSSGLHGSLSFSRDLFDETTIWRMAGNFQSLLERTVEAPGRSLSTLPMLSEPELHQVVQEWGGAPAAGSCSACLHEIFAERARLAPEAVALTCESEVLSYGALDRRANRLAHRLLAWGIGRGSRIGLCVERSLDLVIGILGILKAGAAYVPLDPAYPRERLAFLMEDSGTEALLTEERLREDLPAGLREWVLCLDSDREEIERQSSELPDAGATAEDAAYIIYTSGSTGQPKGVLVPHANVVELFAATADRFRFGPQDIWTLFHSFAFDFSVWELMGALLHGGRLVVVPYWASRSPQAFYELLSREGVTVLNQTPSAFRQLSWAEEEAGAAGRRDLALRWIIFGGEALDARSLLPWFERHGGERTKLVNMYGITETTVHVTYREVGPLDREAGSLLGRPIPGWRVLLLDRQLGPAAPGMPGEILVGGVGLARGYLGRPDLTAERFVPDPFTSRPGGRLYRSGDLALHRPNGELAYLGRIDHQVKLRGFRIELGEIEAALASHPSVREATVLLRGDLPGGSGLVAYVAVAGGEKDQDRPLRGWLEERLPGHMIPAAFVLREALPRTANGKVDRGALTVLPLPGIERGEVGGAGAPPTPAEELLAGIWAEVLHIEQVDDDSDFFALGGHSLLATQVVSRVRAVFGVELPVRSVFQRPTLAGLAAEIAALCTEDRLPEFPPLARVDRGGRLPLSFGQERIWFLEQLAPGSATYNMPVQVELSGALGFGALSSALSEVVRRHESLRTTFVAIAGIPQQRISAPASSFLLPLVDLSTLPMPIGTSEAERLGREQSGRGFDLERGPLFVAFLLRLRAELHHFLLNLHHIVADGWSIGVLVRELGTLYCAFLERRPAELPGLPIQYADFASWQRGWLAEKEAAELAYWEVRLGGQVAPVELPADRPRPAIQTFRGARRRLILDWDLMARLRSFCRAEGVTPFMTLLAATQALLSRHSGERDVPVGAPIAGRRWKETENLIGFFLNTLVLRTDLSGLPSFRELVARVRTLTLEAYSHQDVPFEAILNRLHLERDLSRTPLFQVLFNMLNLPARDLSLPGLDLRLLTPDEVPSKFDLTFYVSEPDSRIWINLVYNADLFDEARIADVLAQIELLLQQGMERPDDRVEDLSLVTTAARAQLPDPTAPLDGSWIGGVHELFGAQALRAPERPAVVDGHSVWSYGDLLARSRRLAGWLASHGVRPGDPVAILAHRSAPLVQAVLGTLTTGAAIMVLDPAYPAARLVEMLHLASPRAWIALQAAGAVPGEVRAWLREAGCPGLELPAGGGAREGFAGFPQDAPGVIIGPQDAACIVFTSGSTGGPKGILGRHGSLSHFLPLHCREFELSSEDRFSLLSGLAHDPLQRDIFTPLYLGATIVIPNPDDIGVAGRWADWMCREGVTVAHLTPALGQLLTEPPRGGEVLPVPSLRRVFLVGESLTRHDVARLRAMAPGVTCVNLYGSTETQRALAFHRVSPEEEAAVERAKQVLPLGRGMQDVQLLVLNRAGRLAGLGEIGEIAVRSPHLARGYLGNEALTAERFQVNPFTEETGDRIYRTGDLGRYRPDGEVEFAGRSDFQVKLRGFRIELGEIEAVLVSHPAVREAAVLLRGDLAGGSGLVAYVATSGAEAGRFQLLRGWLEGRLPGYMTPAAFIHLESLPRTPNGKVDRRALERIAPEMERVAAGDAPRTPTEELLAGIWAQVLGLERVGAEENFFALGGHSLLATQVTSRIKDVFGVELPLRCLFATPTVAGLSADLERASRAAESPPLARADRHGDLLLSFGQQRLWVLDQLQSGSPVYNLPLALRLSGELSVPALQASLSEVVRRHESLRTILVTRGGQPFQRVLPPAAVPLGAIDLGGLDVRERAVELSRLSREHAARPFDLACGPLLRSSLVRLGESEHAVLLNQHHVVSDGWSIGVLVREMVALYGALVAGRPSPLPELAFQYGDFAVWQRRWLSGEVLARQVSHWQERLAGMPALLDLSTDRPRTASRSPRGARVPFHLSIERWRALKDLCRREGITEFMALLGLFQSFLSRLSGQEDVAVGTVIANRGRSELEPLIGFFANTLVMRGDLSGGPSVREVLYRTRESALDAYAHQELPFEHLVEALQPVRSMSHTPLFQVMLVLQNAPRQAFSLPGLTATPIEGSQRTGGARFDLTLDLTETPRGLRGSFEHATDLFDSTTISRLAGHFASLLCAAVAGPSHLISELPLLAAAERQQLVEEWNDTDDAGSVAGLRIHELFEWQAAQRPESLAVSGRGGSLSYGELEARANRLARSLRRLGVGPEARVALCVERSPEMVVALLGILKSGGAYVPLDPDHPAERLVFVLEDSTPEVLVTEERWLAGLGSGGPEVVCLDRDRARYTAEDGSGLGAPPGGDPESPAYVIYTSGSTGRPKGVCVAHRSVVNFLRAMVERLSLGAEVVIPALTTLTFDIAGLEIYLPLALGGRVEVVEREEASDGRALARRMAVAGATALQGTPATWRLLLESGWAGQPGLKALCGGEALPRELASALAARGVELWNLYGPTETAVWSAAGLVAVASGEGAVGLGRPLARTRFQVVDRELELSPVGAAGELLIGGAGVARGYWCRPELTAERFVPDPWSTTAGGRVYRTGDLVRQRADGELEFLGRIDHQVKLRGFRIELGEIEAALSSHSTVRETVVLLRGDLPGGSGLVAYVVLAAAGAEEERVRSLRGWLEECLPGYMVPAAFVPLESLPRTPNGKVDRRALPAAQQTPEPARFVAPRSATEVALARIWSEVLHVDSIGVQDGFFELGGNSLLATRLLARYHETFGIDMSLRDLFRAPTIALLAEAVDRLRETVSVAPPPAIRKISRERYRSKARS